MKPRSVLVVEDRVFLITNSGRYKKFFFNGQRVGKQEYYDELMYAYRLYTNRRTKPSTFQMETVSVSSEIL